MQDKSFYFVADAVTGAPIAKANVEFFAYRQRHIDGNNFQIDTKNFAEATDENGQVFLPVPDDGKDPAAREYQWLATATTPSGRLAYIGFHNVWRGQYLRSPIQRSQNVRDHRPARLSPGPTGAIQVLDRTGAVRCRGQIAVRPPGVRRRNPQPQGRKGLRRNAHVRQLRRHRRQVRVAGRRHAGPVSNTCRQPRRRHVPRRGIQEARVRSHGRRADRARDARRQDHGHDPRQVLLRFAG